MGTVIDNRAVEGQATRVRIGEALVFAGALLAAAALYASLLPWRFGAWADAAPMVIALHGGALLCAIGLFVCVCRAPGYAAGIADHPAVLAMLFVAVWSALVSPFVDFPGLSLLGSPQLGEGALFHADLAIYLAAGMALRRSFAFRTWFLRVVFAVCTLTPVFAHVTGAFDVKGLQFVDYLAWYGVAGAIGVLGLSRLALRRRAVLALAVALPGVVLSSNMTALVLAVAAPAAVLAHLWLVRRGGAAQPIRAAGGIFAAALAAGGVLFVWFAGEYGAMASLTSRFQMYRSLLPALGEDPLIFLIGQGWGRIDTTVLTHLTQSGATIWDGSWDLSTRDIPHSHNFAVEAMFGAGVPALVGTLVMLAAVPAGARRRDLPVALFAVIAVAGMGAMWFQLAATSGLLAIVLGATAGPRKRRIHGSLAAIAARWTLPLAGFLQVVALAWLIAYGVSVDRAIRTDFRSADGTECGRFPYDRFRANAGLARLFGEEYRTLVDAHMSVSYDITDRWDRFARLYCVVAQRSSASASVRLMLADLVFRAEIALNPTVQDQAYRFAADLENWESLLVRFLDEAPARTDVVAPYLSWRLASGEPQTVIAFAERLLSREPDDPVGNWFLGAGLAASGSAAVAENREEMLRRMQFALDHGIARYIKIDPALIDFLSRN